MNHAMRNVRSLLKPGGMLLLKGVRLDLDGLISSRTQVSLLNVLMWQTMLSVRDS
jgi:hypothetical protein